MTVVMTVGFATDDEVEVGEVVVGDDDAAREEEAIAELDVAGGTNLAIEGGKVVCPEVKTAHAPAKTTINTVLLLRHTVCSSSLIFIITVDHNTAG
jgi:hypothetical protein